MSLGLKGAGFEVVAAADQDEVALETHSANIGGLTYLGDLADTKGFLSFLEEYGIRQVDLVAGGPPCQPFSRSGQPKIRSLVRDGRREQRDKRVDLWTSFCAIIDALNPKAVLFENVPDLSGWNGGEVLLGVLQALQERRFTPYARVLTGSEFGVPQHRDRLFVIGLRTGSFRWPNRRARVTLGEAISDLPEIAAGHRDRIMPYGGAKTSFQAWARRGVKRAHAEVVFDHVSRQVRGDDAEAFELLRPGQTYKDLPPRLQRYRSDIFTDKYKRLVNDEPCRTITAHIARDGYWYIHPSQTRTLSIREAARVQTFPDWFRFAGHGMAQYRQIGNAVPPELARRVAHRVRAAIDGCIGTGTVDYSAEFPRDLLRWWRRHRRSFPWRETRDPWQILLAELCLRRTRAQQVANRFGGDSRCRAQPKGGGPIPGEGQVCPNGSRAGEARRERH